ncbi:response regulator transcription factor [Companilactobacillus metriopterae]|uniref:response regulator transcription factor n=1 Tax=Companilactobacillus metriopterae TaxID=1909267 RepID=UPI00100A5990|nr:response regulator transcription factor [Companilactobacillus metriopterae]
MVSIYLAEDQEILISALSEILSLEDDFQVIGTATDGEKALEEIRQLKPDLAILDIEMPKMTGLEVAEQIKDLDTKVVILTVFAQKNYFQKAVNAEVNGYLLKDSKTDYLIDAIHNIMKGDTIYSPDLVKSVLTAEENPFNERETEIIKMISDGSKTADIANTLFLSEGTVRNYISSILSKTGSSSRIEAINVANDHGWI